jgi:protein-tyrosine phosphatase
MPAADEAVAVAAHYGADLTGHRSRALSADLAAQADHLIAMTRGHVRALLEHYPQLGARPRLLNAEGHDLADPIGCPQDVYAECGEQIVQQLEPIVADLVRNG